MAVEGDDLLRAGPHVFVDDLAEPQLRPEDDQHLRRALRRRDGDPLTVSDGRGRWQVFRLGAELAPVGPVIERPVPGPRLSVGIAVPKGDRPDLIVQKLTELGIDQIAVLRAARSVVRWEGARGDRHMERLRRIAREAAMQSRRCTIPEVVGPLAPGALGGAATMVAEPGGGELTATTTTVLIGPEGGWDADERADLGDGLGLGRSILRTETAAIVAAALLVDRHRGWQGWTPEG